jgi:predicted ABC-type ATPase
LKSPDLAVARVADRVRQGGHDIPEATVRSRYIRCVRNFFELFRPMVNTWRIFDNSFAGTPSLVAYRHDEGHEVVLIETV